MATRTTDARLGEFVKDSFLLDRSITLLPSMRTFGPKAHDAVESGPKMNAALRKLLDRPPTLSGKASSKFDGRRIPLALLLVRDKHGATRAGLVVRLTQNDKLVDLCRTDRRGFALLRFPIPQGDASLPRGAVTARIQIHAPGMETVSRDVTVPADRQHIVEEIELEALPPGPQAVNAGAGEEDPPDDPADEFEEEEAGLDVSVGNGEEESAERATATRSLAVGKPVIDLQDNPLDRLPADFSTELCADLTKLLGATEDPIMGLMGDSSDFRRRRIPLIKRLTVPRIGINPPGDKNPPRRYLVRVRQQWTFVGYTLGELANVEGLDPGAVLDEATRTVARATERVSRALDTVTSQALETTESFLKQASSIDALLQASTSVSAIAGAAGFFLPLPIPIFGGGGGARVSVTASTRSSVNTSLLVNSGLHVAKSLINQALRTAASTVRDVENTITKALNRVSPLLSRVTNLLRWTLYENYVVCTHVEDVVEVQAVPITATLGSGTDVLFSDEDIVEYRRILEPLLLEPRLRPHFEILRRAVAQKRAANLPVSVVHVTVDYSTVFARGTLRISVNSEPDQFVTLRPRGSRAVESVRLSIPVAMPLHGTANPPVALQMELSAEADHSLLPPFLAGLTSLPEGSVTISGVRVRLESTPGHSLEMTREFGSDFRTTTGSSATPATQSLDVRVPPPAVFTQGDPLFIHINRNRHYYFGLLAQAALADPSLRDDSALLADFNGDHDLWRLPIVGFEGDRALVISDPDPAIPQVQQDIAMLTADPGAATVIQLAAPGAYGEALQGLLELTDAAGKLHPNLIPAPAPVMPPLALVDITGKPIPVLGSNGTGTAGNGGGSGLPGGIGGP